MGFLKAPLAAFQFFFAPKSALDSIDGFAFQSDFPFLPAEPRAGKKKPQRRPRGWAFLTASFRSSKARWVSSFAKASEDKGVAKDSWPRMAWMWRRSALFLIAEPLNGDSAAGIDSEPLWYIKEIKKLDNAQKRALKEVLTAMIFKNKMKAVEKED